jgi:hypothetical protein
MLLGALVVADMENAKTGNDSSKKRVILVFPAPLGAVIITIFCCSIKVKNMNRDTNEL